MFHKTKVDIRKWIYLLSLMATGEPLSSLRSLSKELDVTKDTIHKMQKRILANYSNEKKNIDEILNKIS
jgi:hypothetical protein